MEISSRRKRILTYILITIVLGFLVLSILVSFFPSSFIDREFSEEIQEHENPFLDFIMKAVSYPGYVPYAPIMVIITASLFYIRKHKREAVFVILTMGSSLLSAIVKFIVNRPRPDNDIVKVLVQTSQKSFPSGHVLFYVVFFGFLSLLMYMFKHIGKRLRFAVTVGCMLMIFIIPISRIYLGAHWFTDVLGGFLLGIVYLFGLSYLYLKRPA